MIAESLSTEQAVDHLLAQMTLEEKVALCHAGSKFAVDAIPRLGIPEFTMSDGPHGVRREISRDSWDFVQTESDYSTYLPTGTALAATWNPSTAYRFGAVLGAEARERGKDVILGPGINIVRTPICGRNFEYYGEDPYHVARLVVPAIQGIQSQDVAACVKHYAANSQELNRTGVDARMDERTLREIYLPGFEAAVKQGGVLTVMGAYNQFRGQYCCHQDYLVNTILKGEWGFEGCFISDWAGAHSTGESARYGLDIEMGTSAAFDDYYLARPFREALERGDLEVALVDDKVRRILRVMHRIGLFLGDRQPGARNTAEHQRAALEIACESIVLLKNDHSVLPLDRSKLQRVVVIGENASERHALGGNSSAVKALYEVTPLEGLRGALGTETEVVYFRGYPSRNEACEPIRPEYLGTADEGAGTHGWKGYYYADREGAWSDAGKVVYRADAAVDFDWVDVAPFPEMEPEQFSIRWETTLTPPQSGSYGFVLTGASHAGLALDELELIQRWENGGPETITKSIPLEAGRAYRLVIRLRPLRRHVRVGLEWVPPWFERPPEEAATEIIQAVRDADAVVFFGGQNHQYDVEGSDRVDMALHDGQNELLAQILGLNPRTAVVLVSGAPVEMPWIEEAPAVVQMWYAGMEGGHAIAKVLLGEINVSGKLPMTFPRRMQDSPAHALGDYAPDVCRYEEEIFVGYRWFDAKEIEPLFPFGHGLSYTTFALSNLRVTREGPGMRVRVEVTNTGKRRGQEVVQIYVGQIKCSVERPIRELKGFTKVSLEPGETADCEVFLEPKSFAFWSSRENAWTVEPGKFVVEAGVSSRDLRCRTIIDFSGVVDVPGLPRI